MRRTAAAIFAIALALTVAACADGSAPADSSASAEPAEPTPPAEPVEPDACDEAQDVYVNASVERRDDLEAVSMVVLDELGRRATRARIVTEQNPDCFTVEQRTDAAAIAHELDQVQTQQAALSADDDSAPEPEPAPPEPEPAPLEPEPAPNELEPTLIPDPARVRLGIRDTYEEKLGRSPDEGELSTATDVWYSYWEAGRDADAAWNEWFFANYQGEMDFIEKKARTREQRETFQNGMDALSCMSNPDGYNCP